MPVTVSEKYPRELVIRVAAAVPNVRLRVDANRSWPRADVMKSLERLALLPIDFVEEPCVDAHELLAQRLPCRIALDESLVELDPAALRRALTSPELAALVCKPTLLGGFARCIELAALAHRLSLANGTDVRAAGQLIGEIVGTVAAPRP